MRAFVAQALSGREAKKNNERNDKHDKNAEAALGSEALQGEADLTGLQNFAEQIIHGASPPDTAPPSGAAVVGLATVEKSAYSATRAFRQGRRH
jgi:hypothetical protein